MARRKRTYFLRFAYLGLLLFVLFMCWIIFSEEYRYSYYGGRQSGIVINAQRQADLGRVFFATFAMFSVVAMHLIGPVLTSTAIGSEKLRRTFDVLLMTPINAWQIVGGKLSSRMLTAVMLIGLTLPVLAIVRLLGGVELDDLFGALALAAATALASAAIGLWLSCYVQRAWAVILLAYLIEAAIYFVLPMLLMLFVAAYERSMRSNMTVGTPYELIILLKVMTASHPVGTTALLTIPGGRIGFAASWWPTVFVQLGLAMVMTLLSARVVRKHARRERGESTGLATPVPTAVLPIAGCAPEAASPIPPPLEYEKPKRFDRPAKARRSVSDWPVLWYELRRPLLARTWQRVFATTVTLALLGLGYLALAANNELDDDDTQIGFAFIFHGLLFLISIVLSATAIANEKESDTWTLLIATPISGATLVFGKLVGVLRRMMWPFLLMVAHFCLFVVGGVLSPWALFIAVWIILTFTLPWIASGLYFSLRCKRVTTAVVLNLLLPVAIYGIVPLVLLAIDSFTRTPGYRPRNYDLPELVMYYIPWYYLGEGMDKFDWNVNWSRLIWMPGGQVSLQEFLIYIFIAGLIQVGLSITVLWWMSARFDRMVGRAVS